MKTQIKRLSKSTLAVILSVCLLISCMTVGIIATDAAKLTGDSAVAAKTDDTAKVGAKDDSESVGAIASRIYFKPGAKWTDASAKFGANFNENGSNYSYLIMTQVSGDTDYYYVDVPSGKTHVQFTRLKSDATSATVDNTWAWGDNVVIPSGKNCFVRSTANDGWDNSGTWTVYIPQDTPVFSLVGNISSDYIVGSSIAESSLSNDTLKWGTHYSAFDVNTGSNGVYSITFTTVSRATLDTNNHNLINIGFFVDGIGQYGTRLGNQNFNTNGADLPVPSYGIADNLYAIAGTGSIVLQPSTTYTITIDQTTRPNSGDVAKITIATTPSYELHIGTNSGNWGQDLDGVMSQVGATSVYERTKSLSAGTYYYYVTTTGASNNAGWYYKTNQSTTTYSATLGSAMSLGEYYARTGNNDYGGAKRLLSYTVPSAGDYKFTFDHTTTGSPTLKIERVSASSSNYSLTGNIDTTYLAEINGVTNTISRGTETEAVWWAKYQTDAAISTVESGTDVYSITVKTVDYATLKANGHDDIDIGLSIKGNTQKGFSYGGTDYNVAGRDYKVTSAGISNASIISATGGSFQLQPGRTYKITVDETNSKLSVACIDVPADKYFLAGQYTGGVAQFFGGTWNTSNNELTYNSTSGCYEKTFTTNIPAGTINFKVVKNGDSDGWDGGSWPTDGNQSYVIKANATSVTFSYNPSTHVTTVTQVNSGGSGGTVSGWMYSKTAPADRTEVNPISGMSAFDASTEGNDQQGKFRFMYGTGDTSLTNAKVPDYFKSGDSSNAYWAELTENITHGSNFFFGLTNYWNQGNLVGNNYEEINDATYNDGTDIEIKDTSNNILFKIQRKQNNNVSSTAKYVLIYEINWEKVSAIGVKAYDNSKSTNNNNTHSGKVDYQIYYKAKVATPVTEAKVVDIVAKNGTLREDYFNRFTKLADTTIEDYFYYEETNASTGEVTTYNSISDYNTAHSSKQIAITHNISYGGSTYEKMENVPVGAKIKISTELSPNSEVFTGTTKFSDSHYLKAYSFNGVTYKVFKPADGVATTNGKKYTEEWTVRAVNTTYHDANDVLQNATTNGNTVEVTPIYYMQDNKNCKTFYIDGYDGTVQNAWGNMLTVYPYYENLSASANAFGGYPGQPMLLWGGKYQMEIPLTVDGTASGATVKGLTLHNGYWDLLHRSIDIRCNARNHAQTYDYDDFYKLYKEKNPDTIIFDFKYKTANDNFGDGYSYFNYDFAGTSGSEPTKDAAHYAASGKNGVEIVTDYFGRQVDVFGNLLTDSQKSDYDSTHPQDKELLIVSTGYKDTYVGEYATLWAVYAPQSSIPSGSNDTAGKFIGYISSSMLYLNNWDRRLQYTGGDSTADGRMSWSQFQTTYDHLKTYYRGVPALISYEKEIWNDSKDKANRSDGKWYYSNKSDKIEASIKIQYGSYTLLEAPDHSVSSDAWNDDPFDTTKTGVGGEKNIGTNTGCSAYFTNTNPNLLGKVASGEQFADSKKSFTFEAVPSGSYMFAGWVRYSNGKYYEITESEIGESPMSSNDVYIARFVDAQTGSLTIQHVVEQTDDYNGTGTPSVTVRVKNGGTDVTGSPYTVSDGSKIDISKWIDSHYAAYTIDISLTTTPNNESFMKNIASSSGNYAPATSTWNSNYTKTNSTGADTAAQTTRVAQFTVQSILDSGITSLRYVSHLMKPLYTYNYEITYTYTSRFWGVQSYTQTGTCEEGDFTGSTTSAVLNTDFIINKTPYEKNFRQQINWNYTASAVGDASAMTNNAATAVEGQANTYKMTAHVYSANTVNDRVTAEFVLPYKYDTKANGYAALQGDMYQTAEQEHNVDLQHTYIYDTSYESFKLTTQAYKLFTYDDVIYGGSDSTLASGLPLIEAAPYVIKDSNYHYYYTTKERYFSSSDDDVAGAQSFMIGNNKYWLNTVPTGKTGTALTAESTATFNGTTYNYAILIDHGTASVYDDELYRFVNVGQPNVQYTYTSWVRTIDGILYNSGGSKKFFTRWDIFNTKGDYVASCYNRRFNYSGYDNYVVKPVYETAPDASGNNPNTYASSTGDGYKSLITFLDDSRNQWNNNGGGDYASTTDQSALWAGDKIFADFAVTYNYNGQNINTVPNRTTDSTNGADIKIGVVIERLDKLDKVGSTTITDASYYANKYKGDTGWQNLAGRLEGSTSGTLTSAVTSGHKCYNSKIGANVSGFGTQFGNPAPGAIDGQTSVIDNFNRLQWFYTINNSTQSTSEATATVTEMKDYAYRAISYIIVTDSTGTHATLTDTPAYFTIYDTASRAHN